MPSWRDYILGLSNLAIYAGAGLILWGALQPWRAIGFDPPNGIEHVNGRITFGLGIVTLALPSVRLLTGGAATRLLAGLFGCLLGGLVVAIGLREINQIRELQNIQGYISPEIGIGLYLTIAGGIFVLGGSLLSALAPTPSRPRVAT